MKFKERIAEKRIYMNPEIVCVKLDNEISLALASSPPEGPYESSNLITKPEYMTNEPFMNGLS